MGGTNDPDNLIELSVEEHAAAHRTLYEQYGKNEDLLAWQGLTASIGQEDLLMEKARIGGKNNTKPKTEEHKRKLSVANKGKRVGGVTQHTAATKQRISETMKGHSNSKNHNSEEYKTKQSVAMKAAWAKRKQGVA